MLLELRKNRNRNGYRHGQHKHEATRCSNQNLTKERYRQTAFGTHKELSALVLQMCIEKIRLCELSFHSKVAQGDQTVKLVLFECRLYNLIDTRAQKPTKETGRCLDLERSITDGPCAKNIAVLMKETGLTDRSRATNMEESRPESLMKISSSSSLLLLVRNSLP